MRPLLSLLEKPHIHLEFANLFSLLFIAALLLGLIGWITYVAFSISALKARLQTVVTKEFLAAEFVRFKKDLASGK